MLFVLVLMFSEHVRIAKVCKVQESALLYIDLFNCKSCGFSLGRKNEMKCSENSSFLLSALKEIKIYFHETLEMSMPLQFPTHPHRNMFEYFRIQIPQITVSHAVSL